MSTTEHDHSPTSIATRGEMSEALQQLRAEARLSLLAPLIDHARIRHPHAPGGILRWSAAG